MCKILLKPMGSYLFSSDIETLPQQDFQKIDHLWTKYSHGHFGFSTQREIYLNCHQDYGHFCSAVGWNLIYSTSPRNTLTFRLSAPMGHLPSHIWVGGTQLGRHMKTLVEKLDNCYK